MFLHICRRRFAEICRDLQEICGELHICRRRFAEMCGVDESTQRLLGNLLLLLAMYYIIIIIITIIIISVLLLCIMYTIINRNLTVPQGGIRKGGSRQNTTLSSLSDQTVILLGDLLVGSPFSDPPFGGR